MNPEVRPMLRRRQRGQTIIVAMIVLGLLLILGFVFLGIINHSIKTSGQIRDRSVAKDLSESGIRYAHSQLLNSAQGADWRGQPTTPIDWTNGIIETTRDPDALFIRPPATIGGGQVAWPGGNYADRGGPDGLGPFFRVPNSKGRALVRVIYGPSDADVFRSSPTGALRNPGALRNYIMIESIGREGVINANDPTRLLSTTARRIGNYGSTADFVNELNLMKGDQVHLGGLQVNRAFVSIGIIESARFITNKNNVSRPADIGSSNENGAFYRDGLVTDLPTQFGLSMPLLAFDSNSSTTPGPLPIGGSLFSNADVALHGRILANLNLTLGDQFDVAGHITGDDDARLVLQLSRYNGGWGSTTNTLAPAQFSSQSPGFNGLMALRDGGENRDLGGGPRSVGQKVPPSAFGRDAETHVNRYQEMTQSSGAVLNGRNTGGYGYGNGVFVNNSADRQSAVDELGRVSQGGEASLINDWLNPSRAGSFWTGYLYNPPGSYVNFTTDGFTITRDGRSTQPDQRNWKLPNGNDSGAQVIRYKLGRGTDGRLHIVNTFSVANINNTLSQTDYQTGPEFNGVLYLEGNARVRGVIPTDIQITLVSGATIYVEGSLTKGVTGNNWTATYSSARDNIAPTAQDQRLTRPSKSMLMLIARDYVAVNTTQFFGAAPTQAVTAKQDLPNLPSYNPLLVKAADVNGLELTNEFVLDPAGQGATASNPSTWKSFAANYSLNSASGTRVPTNILLTQTQDDGAAASTYVSLQVNGGQYMFPTGPNPPYANAASQYTTNPYFELYGLGMENYQRFGKFESITLPLIDASSSENALGITSSGTFGSFGLSTLGPNRFTLKPQSIGSDSINDYVLGRLALAPHDIRIEASMFAENGSFFVIPGPWFNPNPNDNYNAWFTASAGDPNQGNRWRLENFGSTPNIPFYGEPLDVRILISGAISENMPPTASQQAEWIRKWGWIPKRQGAATVDTLPFQHLSNDPGLVSAPYVPNIIVGYDPVLATGRRFGFYDPSSGTNLNDPGTYVRTRWIDYNMDGIQQISELVPLPPLPRLPVSPALAYFGEVH